MAVPAPSSARILVIDDDASILELLGTVLRRAGYSQLQCTPDPRGVLAHFFEFDPDLLILDISMPHLNGLRLLELLHQSAPSGLAIPVIVITAMPGSEVRLQALKAGASEVLSKPFSTQEFVLRVANLLKLRLAFHDANAQNHALFEELIDRAEELAGYQVELKKAQLEVIARLARAGEQHDDVTGQHTQRVATTARLLAQGLQLPREKVDLIGRAAPLHDVGKIGVPDPILLKPAGLTSEEWEVMKNHCLIGSQLLSGGSSDIVQMAECIALTHHEKWNGNGYPHALSGQNIPIEGRILAVADVFDALTHVRPYKHAWTIEQALKEIQSQSGHDFDPQIVEIFLNLPHDKLV